MAAQTTRAWALLAGGWRTREQPTTAPAPSEMRDRRTLTSLPSYRSISLIVDVSLVTRPTARTLTEAGYRVFEAGSAAEALELLRTARRPIDLVRFDVMMPEMNGVELVREGATLRIIRSRYTADAPAAAPMRPPACS